MATLTYVYAEQTAVVGRLATLAEPHTYDLCAEHARSLTAPRGWQVVRLVSGFEDAVDVADDLLAVANAVDTRRATRVVETPAPSDRVEPAPSPKGEVRGRHLRILRDG